MFLIGKFKRSNNFFPKYRIPISAKIIKTLSTITDPKTLLLANKAAIKKQN